MVRMNATCYCLGDPKITMKKIFAVLALALVCLALNLNQPAWADAAAGKRVFDANCAACHLGGKNLISPARTLKMTDLQANKIDAVGAIVTQVTNGKGPMPSFKDRLTPAEIADVSAYVLSRAEKGW
jgi:cytochrome c6